MILSKRHLIGLCEAHFVPILLLGEAKRWLKAEPLYFVTFGTDLAKKFIANFYL